MAVGANAVQRGVPGGRVPLVLDPSRLPRGRGALVACPAGPADDLRRSRSSCSSRRSSISRASTAIAGRTSCGGRCTSSCPSTRPFTYGCTGIWSRQQASRSSPRPRSHRSSSRACSARTGSIPAGRAGRRERVVAVAGGRLPRPHLQRCVLRRAWPGVWPSPDRRPRSSASPWARSSGPSASSPSQASPSLTSRRTGSTGPTAEVACVVHGLLDPRCDRHRGSRGFISGAPRARGSSQASRSPAAARRARPAARLRSAARAAPPPRRSETAGDVRRRTLPRAATSPCLSVRLR